MWTFLKELLPKTRDSGIANLKVNGTEISDLNAILYNIFNSFFIDVGAKLASCIPDSRHSPFHYLRNFMPTRRTHVRSQREVLPPGMISPAIFSK